MRKIDAEAMLVDAGVDAEFVIDAVKEVTRERRGGFCVVLAKAEAEGLLEAIAETIAREA